jgi:hypothetical protein
MSYPVDPQDPYGQSPYGGYSGDPNDPNNPYRYGPPEPQPQYGQYPYWGQQPPPGTNGMAIAGFVLAFFCTPLGIVFSAVGLNQTNRTGQKGRGLAIAGLVISIVSIIIGVAVFVATDVSR